MRANGPAPKRRAEILGHRSNAELTPDTVRIPGLVKPPAIPKKLHPVARRWYRSLRRSGQAQYYEPSDWALAVFIAHQMDAAMNVSILGFNANNVKAIVQAGEALLCTETSRRRVRIEVERVLPGTGGDGEKPKEIRDYRARLRTVDSESHSDGTEG